MLFHFSHSLSKLPKTGYKKRPHLPHRAWRRRYKTAVPLRFVTFGSPLFCCPNGALRRPLHQNTACPAHGNGGCRRQLLRQSRFTAHAAGGTSQPRCRGALTAVPLWHHTPSLPARLAATLPGMGTLQRPRILLVTADYISFTAPRQTLFAALPHGF